MADARIVQDWIANKNLNAFSFYNEKENYKVIDIVIVHPLDFEAAFENKDIKKANGFDVNVVSIDDLIKMKKLVGRSQDISDIKMLRKVKKFMR